MSSSLTLALYSCGGCDVEVDGSIKDRDGDPLCLRCALMPGPGDAPGMGIQDRLARVGKTAVVAVVKRHRWSLAKAADAMGISHTSLYWWMSHNARKEMQAARNQGFLSPAVHSRTKPKYEITGSKEKLIRAVKSANGDMTAVAKTHGVSSGRVIRDAFKRLAPSEYAEWQAARAR